jgi:glycogen synthase kinase 3 beta
MISKILVYTPDKRLKPLEAILHPFFDELRDQNTKLPNGNPMPDLFDFSKEEISSASPDLIEQLIPAWYRHK